MSETGPGGTGCRDGHRARPTPAEDPALGLVPTRAATWLGALVLAAALALAWWLLPAAHGWILAALATWLLITFAVQVALGHRGRCLVRRTTRWFLGPAGALLDPTDGT